MKPTIDTKDLSANVQNRKNVPSRNEIPAKVTSTSPFLHFSCRMYLQ